jgi:hypothetical protein
MDSGLFQKMALLNGSGVELPFMCVSTKSMYVFFGQMVS